MAVYIRFRGLIWYRWFLGCPEIKDIGVQYDIDVKIGRVAPPQQEVVLWSNNEGLGRVVPVSQSANPSFQGAVSSGKYFPDSSRCSSPSLSHLAGCKSWT